MILDTLSSMEIPSFICSESGEILSSNFEFGGEHLDIARAYSMVSTVHLLHGDSIREMEVNYGNSVVFFIKMEDGNVLVSFLKDKKDKRRVRDLLRR